MPGEVRSTQLGVLFAIPVAHVVYCATGMENITRFRSFIVTAVACALVASLLVYDALEKQTDHDLSSVTDLLNLQVILLLDRDVVHAYMRKHLGLPCITLREDCAGGRSVIPLLHCRLCGME